MPSNILAWNNDIGPWYYFVGLRTKVMIKIIFVYENSKQQRAVKVKNY